MNKRGLAKFVFVLMASIASFYFMLDSDSGFDSMFNSVMICNFILALTIFMYSNKNKIVKGKLVYDVILILLLLFSLAYSINFIYSEIAYLFNISYSTETSTTFTIIFPVFLFIMILFSFKDIFNKTDKVNDILTIVVSTIIILIHIRYYVDPNFIHKIIKSDSYIQSSYYYIFQNYIYFVVMYFVVLTHRFVNKVS
ncbi:MAG: hypothetical protein WC343_01425 [Bacilli bacterium]|jgi:drug/metabolite transporter (DMT)-like permease